MSAYDWINPSMVRLLRSRWHAAQSKRIMVVDYLGRKSGKAFSTPVSYYRDGDLVYCFTNGRWRYNFNTPHDATLLIRGHEYPATGRIDNSDREQQIDVMTAYFKAVPQDRKFYGVRCDGSGEPIRSQVANALEVIDIIRFEL